MRIAYLQCYYRPSYKLAQRNLLGEPLIVKPGPSNLWQVEECVDICQAVAHANRSRKQRILNRTIEACQEFGVNCLVLPEYFCHADQVSGLRKLAMKKKMLIVAASQAVLAEKDAIKDAYRNSEIVEQFEPICKAYPSTFISVCPVLLPDGKVELVTKEVPSRYESEIAGIPPHRRVLTVKFGGRDVDCGVIVCSDFATLLKKGLNHDDEKVSGLVLLMPCFTPDTAPMEGVGQVGRACGSIVILANSADTGGSRIFAPVDTLGSQHWDLQGDGSKPLPAGHEALMVVEIDSNVKGIQTGVVDPDKSIRPIAHLPLHYSLHCDICAIHLGGQHSRAFNLEETALYKRVDDTKAALDGQLADRRTRYFSKKGELSSEDARYLSGALVVPDLAPWASFQSLIVEHALGQLLEKLSSTRGLHSKVGKDLALLDNCRSPVPETHQQDAVIKESFARSKDIEASCEDRDVQLEALGRFLRSENKSIALVVGLPGSGRRTVLQRFYRGGNVAVRICALPKAPEFDDLVSILTSLGISTTPPGDEENVEIAAATATRKALEELFAQGITVVQFDELENLFDRNGEVVTPVAHGFLRGLAMGAPKTVPKVILVSRFTPSFPEETRRAMEAIEVRDLPPEAARRLLNRVIANGSAATERVSDEVVEDILELSGRHALALKVLGSAVANGESLDNLPRLHRDVIRRVLNEIELSKNEIYAGAVIAVFGIATFKTLVGTRLLGPRELAEALDRLQRLCIVERDRDGDLRLHSLFREYFINGVTAVSLANYQAIHRAAADWYMRLGGSSEASPLERARALQRYAYHCSYSGIGNLAKEELARSLPLLKEACEELLRSGQADLAAQIASMLTRHFPGFWNYVLLARAQARWGCWDESLQAAREALRYRPHAAWLYGDLADSALYQDNVYRAKQYVELGLAVNPDDPGVLLAHGRILERDAKDPSDWLDAFKRAWGLSTRFVQRERSAYFYARALFNAARWAEALKVIEECEGKQQLTDRLWGLKARCLCAMGDTNAAAECLTRVVRKGTTVEKETLKAILELPAVRKGRLAEDEIAKVLTLVPSKPYLQAEIGLLLVRKGAVDQGVDLCEQARRRAPRDLHILHCLLLALKAAADADHADGKYESEHGRRQRAKIIAADILRIDPTNDAATELLT